LPRPAAASWLVVSAQRSGSKSSVAWECGDFTQARHRNPLTDESEDSLGCCGERKNHLE